MAKGARRSDFAPFLEFLALDTIPRPGNRLQPRDGDFLAAHHALTVIARINPAQRVVQQPHLAICQLGLLVQGVLIVGGDSLVRGVGVRSRARSKFLLDPRQRRLQFLAPGGQ